jgi:hypothetical protein
MEGQSLLARYTENRIIGTRGTLSSINVIKRLVVGELQARELAEFARYQTHKV